MLQLGVDWYCIMMRVGGGLRHRVARLPQDFWGTKRCRMQINAENYNISEDVISGPHTCPDVEFG